MFIGKKFWFMVVLTVVLTVVVAQADLNTTHRAMTLTFDVDGYATLTNTSGAAIGIEAYEIQSIAGNCDPTTWVSISDSSYADPIGVMSVLGAGALSFGELGANTTILAEASLSSSAIFQPDSPWSIGKPLLAETPISDLSFRYLYVGGTPGDSYEGNIIFEQTLLVGDANLDGVVSAGDYASVQANFGSTGILGILGDANGDGVVSAGDYASVQANFGNTSPTIITPEPATISLLIIGGFALLKHRRK